MSIQEQLDEIRRRLDEEPSSAARGFAKLIELGEMRGETEVDGELITIELAGSETVFMVEMVDADLEGSR